MGCQHAEQFLYEYVRLSTYKNGFTATLEMSRPK